MPNNSRYLLDDPVIKQNGLKNCINHMLNFNMQSDLSLCSLHKAAGVFLLRLNMHVP